MNQQAMPGMGVTSETQIDRMVEAVYQECPRKGGKQHAKRAIRRVLENMGSVGGIVTAAQFERLRKATQKYRLCSAASGMPIKSLPLPATWFNKGGWMKHDDQAANKAERVKRADEAQVQSLAAEKAELDMVLEGLTAGERDELANKARATLNDFGQRHIARLRGMGKDVWQSGLLRGAAKRVIHGR